MVCLRFINVTDTGGPLNQSVLKTEKDKETPVVGLQRQLSK